MNAIYHKTLMDHYKNPRNNGGMSNASFTSRQTNVLCGDEISMHGKIVNGRMCALLFEGKGCIISQATASLLTQRAQGCTMLEISAFDDEYIKSLIGISLGAVRLKCATLSLHALKTGVKKYSAISNKN